MYKKIVKLADGTEVMVAPVPPQVYDDVNAAFPDPPKPVKITKTVTGEDLQWYDEQDEAYQAALAEVQRRRREALFDQTLLWGLPDVQTPEDDGWLEYIAANRRELFPDWQPPTSERGRRLLYIKYVLLSVHRDILAVREAINEVSGIPTGRIAEIEESFRPDLAENS